MSYCLQPLHLDIKAYRCDLLWSSYSFISLITTGLVPTKDVRNAINQKHQTTGCHATAILHIVCRHPVPVYLSAYLSVLSVCSQQLSPGDIMAICDTPEGVRIL